MSDIRQLEETHLIEADLSVRQAIRKIDRNRSGAVCVVDPRCRLLGILTDGDIRRLVLRGLDLESETVEGHMQRRPITATADFSRTQLCHLMRARSISQIPIVGPQNEMLGIALAKDLMDVPQQGRRAVVMAGGRGVRLRPLTEERPKPLLPVGGRPIIELIIERLVGCGFDDILVTTAYRSQMIEDHLQDGGHLGAAIRYLREAEPLGTAGGLALLPEDVTGDLLVVNGDILTTLDYAGMLESHAASGADLTVAVREVVHRVDYGVIQSREEWITRIEEKPRTTMLVNAGIYIVGERMRRLIPRGRRFHMTDLVKYGLGEKRRIRSYPLREYWMDIGRMDDYRRANEELTARTARKIAGPVTIGEPARPGPRG